jgi:hypothetical protein
MDSRVMSITDILLTLILIALIVSIALRRRP